MLNVKKLITETIRSVLLTEGLSNILYHFTSISNGYSICSEDAIYLQSAYAKESDNYDKKRKFYLSCTRLFNSSFGYSSKFSSGGVRIKLDGEKLAQRFKGRTVNYWHGLNDKYTYYEKMPKNKQEFDNSIRWELNRFKREHPEASEQDIQKFINYNFNKSAQKHIDNETEDRILSYEPVIRNAHEYILSIDFLMPNILNDEKYRKMAYSLLYKTPLGRYVKIFNSVEDFNNLNAKSINPSDLFKETYYDETFSNTNLRGRLSVSKDALKYTVLFISYANHDFDNNFGQMVSKLLQKYELTHFSKEIGDIVGFKKTWNYTLTYITEKLGNLRRSLSDEPNKDNSKILKMLTDYLLSIGANSFRDGYKIKQKMVEEYYGNSRVYDRIDTSVKKDFIIINYCLIIDPKREKFSDLAKYVLKWDDERMKQEADSLSYTIVDDNYSNPYKYNKEKTKNTNSMFQYLYKLFRTGTIEQVLGALNILNNSADEYDSVFGYLGLDVKYKQMDYWEASNYSTLNVYKYETLNKKYDYKKSWKIRDNDIESVFPPKQNA